MGEYPHAFMAEVDNRIVLHAVGEGMGDYIFKSDGSLAEC